MIVEFPYSEFEPLKISEVHKPQVFEMPNVQFRTTGAELVKLALTEPIGSKRLSELAIWKKKVLIVVDDISRPTPVSQFVHLIIEELQHAGISKDKIEFLMALGTHRAMTQEEMTTKLGTEITSCYQVHNHQWDNPDCLSHIGDTNEGIPVWINKLVRESDLVVGLGSIMPIEVCGFTGGGKILVPGVSGQVTVDQMHWTRIDVPAHHITGKSENPIRASIDSLARKAGLNFIVNVVLNSQNQIVGAVAGDMVTAHRKGCEIARKVFGVQIPHEFDIVIADGYPFDIEFWQVNKALDTAGIVVKKGGVVIIVSPCYEGFSQTHNEILEFGYTSIENIKKLVQCGKILHKVVGVHMIQVSSVAIEKAKVILVSTGISKENTEKAGLMWAQTPQNAFENALLLVGKSPSIAVLKNASQMLPLMRK
ncbi:MAG: hypothetical protein UW91_C0024G0006 [Parcubacteria group bacterium GW2011_GWF2_45_11]|nr:MAG: hypothetical protein UW91_C0024G0006 [Parcubacteria group bacterium GW2011_GWF2_45_11]OHB42172.1 MAG: hypothetical protein A2Y13_05170 [Planctomycetes bacterium GWC2_45_44]